MISMQLRKKLLKSARLYLILDAQVNSYPELLDIAGVSAKAGVDILQLRDKRGGAKDILDLSKRIRSRIPDHVLFILNDRVDLALLAQADGVHVGQDDIPVKEVKRLSGKKLLIGQSCQTLRQVQQAKACGADYVGFGSVFKTKTKPDRSPMEQDLFKRVIQSADVPLFSIGGINLDRVKTLMNEFGAERFAVCRDISCAKNIKKQVQQYKEILRG